jgi:hypothetical protein
MSKKKLLWLVGCSIFILVFLLQPAMAGIEVTGAIFKGDGLPGDTLTHQMIIKTGNEDPVTNVSIKVMGFIQEVDGTYLAVDPANDVNPYSARSFISLDKNSVLIEPGKTAMVIATIKIPRNVGDGGRTALIHIEGQPAGSGVVRFVTAVNVPIFLTIKKSAIKISGSITDIQVQEPPSGGALKVITTLKNTGNLFFYRPYANITILDSANNMVFFGSGKPSPFAIIPSYAAQLSTQVDAVLEPGLYTIISKAYLENGSILDEKSIINYEVKKAYIPPFKETSITVMPQSEAVLSSPDGIVTIHFPQGAVLDETKITVSPVSSAQLPNAPSGAKLGVTGLLIEGLSGLLSKDATITLKYNADDLAIASGDASKLSLARYDKTVNAWTLMPTTVNQTARTLTTTTNRMSIWAVMVSEGAIPVGTKTPGFTVGIAMGALALLVIVNHWRRRR